VFPAPLLPILYYVVLVIYAPDLHGGSWSVTVPRILCNVWGALELRSRSLSILMLLAPLDEVIL